MTPHKPETFLEQLSDRYARHYSQMQKFFPNRTEKVRFFYV